MIDPGGAAWDSAEPDGLDSEALDDTAFVSCPYCGEEVEIAVDPTGGADQRYVEDCEVCCRPWAVHVTVDPSGFAHASVTALDDA